MSTKVDAGSSLLRTSGGFLGPATRIASRPDFDRALSRSAPDAEFVPFDDSRKGFLMAEAELTPQQTRTRLVSPRHRAMKVPQATPSFWAGKLATTAFGEALSDFVFFNDYIGQHRA